MRFLALLLPLVAFAQGGVPVSPDAKYQPPPPGPPKAAKVPPDCVAHLLDVIFNAEKEFYAAKKTYSTSYLEMHAASKLGVGCPGWDLPAVELFYGGGGYKATITEDGSGLKWIMNQDHWVYAEEKPAPKK